jgi:threonine dehydratase
VAGGAAVTIGRAALDEARGVVGAAMAPTPQINWPLLDQAVGCRVWLKHENHTPLGAFKVRGGLVYLRRWAAAGGGPGVIAATRGNHGQAVAFAAAREGVTATVVTPRGNSPEKNAAMRALGATLIEAGDDFSEALALADELAHERDLHFVPSFHPDLVLGVATYAEELFGAVADLDVVYVPVGLGSGICGVIGVRDLLGLATRVVGVVAEGAPAYARSFAAGEVVATDGVATFADGAAVRVPDARALEVILAGAERIVTVPDEAIADATRLIFTATHNVAEGAGALALAGLLADGDAVRGARAAAVLSGGNVDASRFATVLRGGTPAP